MAGRETFTSGDIVRAEFYWTDKPRNDGKDRNCVILAANGRKAIICPITSVPPDGNQAAVELPARMKHGIDRLDDDKPSWIILSEQNVVFTDGPRMRRSDRAGAGDARIFGRLPGGFADHLRKSTVSTRISGLQSERDWKEEIRSRQMEAGPPGRPVSPEDRLERVQKAARNRAKRQEPDRPRRPKLGIKKRDGKESGIR